MTEDQKAKLALFEMISSVCWFLMDASWMFALYIVSQIMAALTIASSLLIFRYTERNWSDMLITAATLFWAAMNVCWMLNDSKVIAWGVIAGGYFFGAGTLCLLGAFCAGSSSRQVLDHVVTRFRRLRITRRD